MSSAIGDTVKLSVFGESHGEAIGCVLSGLPAGEALDQEEILTQMARRAPGKDKTATTRKESDTPEIVSGLLEGRTTGAPLAMLIHNTNQRSGDYAELARLPRPGHADYTGYVRYHGFNDVRGGGHFSGRITAPLVFTGAVCRQILKRRGITVGGHVYAIAGAKDIPFDPLGVDASLLDRLAAVPFPLIDREREAAMREQVEDARLQQDSVGGIVEVAACGLPAGLGSPMFDGIENKLAALFFGIPAVKGVEFGDGFGFAALRGSQANDPYTYTGDGEVIAASNHNGGLLGGITNGMPLIARLAVKPTSSISQKQRTVDLVSGRDAELVVKGRHDPCIVPRAVPVAESMLAFGLLDRMESERSWS
ncbi:MAG: chorismate synthase [Clostridiales bacterium]|jgi:chorismate synthase|nr:chorismate synthase [Clostridiales bacterium]